MIQNIRDHMHGWISAVIVFLLVVMTALWGISSYFSGGVDNLVVAKVNDTEISREQFSIAYEQARRQLHNQLGVAFPLSSNQEILVKEQVLRNLISNTVLKQSSLAGNYRISTGQVNDYLTSIPDFQENNKFSLSKFQEIMNSSIYSAVDLLDLIETNLLIMQPKLGITVSAFALPYEVKTMIDLITQERNIKYVLLDKTSISGNVRAISKPEVLQYYKQNQSEFKTLEQVSIEYLELSLSDIMRNINPTKTAIRNYYNANIKNFVRVETVNKNKLTHVEPFAKVYTKVRDILIRQQAEEIMYNLRDKLADLAYEHPNSLEIAAHTLGLQVKTSALFTKDKGGQDISSIPKVRLASFSADVLNMHNNSDLIQINPEKIIVLRVKNHLLPTLLPINAVSQQIAAKLQNNIVQKQLEDYAHKVYVELQDQSSSEESVTTKYHLLWHDAGLVGRYNNKLASAILDSAFQLPNPALNKLKKNYGLVSLPNGYAVITVNNVKNNSKINDKQTKLFRKRLKASNAMIEYELYKQYLLNHAKIVLKSAS